MCRNVFIDFCERMLSDLDKCDKPSLAKAWQRFEADRDNMRLLLHSSGLDLSFDGFEKDNTGFSPDVNINMRYSTGQCSSEYNGIFRTYRLKRLSSLLTVDFFEGLIAGHYPRRCGMCGRYFLMENAKNTKYCNGYYPGDKKNRTCRTVANRQKDKQREYSEDHPVKSIYRTRCNTVDHHLRSGVISERKAKTVKQLARDKMFRALRDNEYFLDEYEKEMTQEAIYAEADALLREECSS